MSARREPKPEENLPDCCELRGKWVYLCTYHEGYEDGRDSAQDEIDTLMADLATADEWTERIIVEFPEANLNLDVLREMQGRKKAK